MKTLAVLILVLFAGIGFSQDLIKLKNGKVEEVLVVEVNSKTISYRIDSKNENSAIYTIALDKVESVQYSSGKIDDFAILNEEKADLTKLQLIEVNMIDFAFQRASIFYEVFPSVGRNWSLTVPLRFNFSSRHNEVFFNNKPWFETGLGANAYVFRKNKHNLLMGIEMNYTFDETTFWTWDPNGIWQELVTEKRHHLGFYTNFGYKYNFRPRLGLNFSTGIGWRYRVNSTTSYFQAKLNIGAFYRF